MSGDTDSPKRGPLARIFTNDEFPCIGWWLRPLRMPRVRKWIIIVLAIVVTGYVVYEHVVPWGFEMYTGVTNEPLYYPNSVEVSDAEFEAIAADLRQDAVHRRAMQVTAATTDSLTRSVRVQMIMRTPSFIREAEYPHVRYFREAGIRQYTGPETCTQCHETMTVTDHQGRVSQVNTMDDVLNTVHYRFQSMAGGFTTYGYDGRQVNAGTRTIPVGKIDRACGVPGSFSWTGWAALIRTVPAHAHGDTVLRSEGCGQCHIGGGFHPATEQMMPRGVIPTPEVAGEGLDCLICHAAAYDMNQRYVLEDEHGHMRWNQDRSLRSAMTVGRPGNENCLNCHQHNMGGDTYDYNRAAQSLGVQNQRLLHAAAKRGNPFSAQHDVHYRAGLVCIDCHIPIGHKIPRGNKGTDLVANDLPGVRVDCEMCHTSAPHVRNEVTRVVLNGHVARLACETCHIRELMPFNNVLRMDWVHPTWNEEEGRRGMYTPTIVYNNGRAEPGVHVPVVQCERHVQWRTRWGPTRTGNPEYNPLMMNQMTRITDPVAIQSIAQNTGRDA